MMNLMNLFWRLNGELPINTGKIIFTECFKNASHTSPTRVQGLQARNVAVFGKILTLSEILRTRKYFKDHLVSSLCFQVRIWVGHSTLIT